MTGEPRPRRAKPPSEVRISAGRWKARRLELPGSARPTSARAREALFDILQTRVPGARLLDLYAGSGAVGLEAVSRGAARAVLVEREADAVERNVSLLAAPAAAVEVLRLEASRAIAQLQRRGERFEIVFADPPYDVGLAPEVAQGVGSLLAADGIFVLQTDPNRASVTAPSGLRPCGERCYGRNVFRFFERADTAF